MKRFAIPSQGTFFFFGQKRACMIDSSRCGSFILATAFFLSIGSAAVADDDKTPPEKKTPTKDDYKLDTSSTSSSLKLNQDGLFSLSILPVEGLKVHPDAPLEIKLTTSSGLTSSKKKLGRKDAVDEKSTAPTLQTAIRGETAGEKEVQADVSFFLCSKALCQRMTDRLTVQVQIFK